MILKQFIRSASPTHVNQTYLGVIGNPLGHSLSPRLHNFAASKLGLNTLYLPFAVERGEVSDLLREAWQDERVLGFNVTTPYKELVASLVANADGARAVNTLYRGGGAFWSACSTDGAGFERALTHMGVVMSQLAKIIFMGSGGAVLAILDHLRQLELAAGDQAVVPEVVIMRRTPAVAAVKSNKDCKFLQLKLKASLTFAAFDEAVFEKLLRESTPDTLVVQATNAPLHGEPLHRYAPCLDSYSGSFVDLLYGSNYSSLLPAAKRLGLRCQDGLPMLVEQARASQRYWWQQDLPYEETFQYLAGVL